MEKRGSMMKKASWIPGSLAPVGPGSTRDQATSERDLDGARPLAHVHAKSTPGEINPGPSRPIDNPVADAQLLWPRALGHAVVVEELSFGCLSGF